MKTKKAFSGMLAAMMLIGALAGCGKDGADNGKIQLNVGNWPVDTNTEDVALFKEWAAQYEDMYPNVDVIEGNTYAYNPETFNVKATAGQLPAQLDTYFTEIKQIMNAGYSADITEQLKENGLYDVLNPDLLELATDENGKVYGFPKEAYAIGLAINKKLFKEAGLVNADGTPKVPQTYEELAEYSKIIKEKTGAAGFVIPTTENCGGWIFMNIAWSHGVEFEEKQSDGTWKAIFDTEQFRNAVQYVKDLRWKHNVLPDNKVINQEEQQKLFGTGQAAMTLAAPDIVNRVVTKYGTNKDDIYFARVPEGIAGRYAQMGGGITIFNANNTPEQTDAAIKWLMMRGRTPEITPEVEEALRKGYESTIKQGGVVFPKTFFDVWQDEERDAKVQAISADYANVDMKDYEDYASFKDVTVRPEESACCQQLYAVLDGVIQAVLTDENADVNQLTKTAVNDFQKNHLDKLN